MPTQQVTIPIFSTNFSLQIGDIIYYSPKTNVALFSLVGVNKSHSGSRPLVKVLTTYTFGDWVVLYSMSTATTSLGLVLWYGMKFFIFKLLI